MLSTYRSLRSIDFNLYIFLTGCTTSPLIGEYQSKNNERGETKEWIGRSLVGELLP